MYIIIACGMIPSCCNNKSAVNLGAFVLSHTGHEKLVLVLLLVLNELLDNKLKLS
jgi:hypothetical protein